MSHQPKFTDTTQRLINACQAVEGIKGVFVTINLEAANAFAASVPTGEFDLFDFETNKDRTFTLTLKP